MFFNYLFAHCSKAIDISAQKYQFISSAEVYLAGRSEEPHIYPISFSLQLQLGLHPHQGGGMFIDNLYGYQYP